MGGQQLSVSSSCTWKMDHLSCQSKISTVISLGGPLLLIILSCPYPMNCGLWNTSLLKSKQKFPQSVLRGLLNLGGVAISSLQWTHSREDSLCTSSSMDQRQCQIQAWMFSRILTTQNWYQWKCPWNQIWQHGILSHWFPFFRSMERIILSQPHH